MEWTLFIFKRGNKHYLVDAMSEESAWKTLSNRMSWSMDVCRKQFSLIKIMNGCGQENVVVL
jgi:hypothetical protein